MARASARVWNVPARCRRTGRAVRHSPARADGEPCSASASSAACQRSRSRPAWPRRRRAPPAALLPAAPARAPFPHCGPAAASNPAARGGGPARLPPGRRGGRGAPPPGIGSGPGSVPRAQPSPLHGTNTGISGSSSSCPSSASTRPVAVNSHPSPPDTTGWTATRWVPGRIQPEPYALQDRADQRVYGGQERDPPLIRASAAGREKVAGNGAPGAGPGYCLAGAPVDGNHVPGAVDASLALGAPPR